MISKAITIGSFKNPLILWERATLRNGPQAGKAWVIRFKTIAWKRVCKWPRWPSVKYSLETLYSWPLLGLLLLSAYCFTHSQCQYIIILADVFRSCSLFNQTTCICLVIVPSEMLAAVILTTVIRPPDSACTAWRVGLRRVLGLPATYSLHSSAVNFMSSSVAW